MAKRNDKFFAATQKGFTADKNGNVYRDGIPIEPYQNNSLYYFITFKYGTNAYTILVHRFIWEFFNGSIPEDKEIDHVNWDRMDNRLSNLEAVTHSVNIKRRKEQRRKVLENRGL